MAHKRHANSAEMGLLIGVLQKLLSEVGPCWTAVFATAQRYYEAAALDGASVLSASRLEPLRLSLRIAA